MTIKYLSPYKDDPYGKLRGDKADVYFGVDFSEALIHKTDDAYIIAGFVTKYKSVVRHYKPEEELKPGNCALFIYGKEYEVRKKDSNGQWVSEKITPSLFEVALYKMIAKNEDDWMPFASSIMLQFTHVPNGMCEGKTEDELGRLVKDNVKLTQCDPSGALPEYKVPVPYDSSKSKGGWKGLSPENKMEFLIKQLQADVQDVMVKKSDCLAELVDQLIVERVDCPNFLELYAEFVTACVR